MIMFLPRIIYVYIDMFSHILPINIFLHTHPTDRLKCSFAFADRPSAHRHIDKNKMVTIDQVYKNTTIVCQVWDFIRNMTEFPSYGYLPWKGIHCPPRTNPAPMIPCHMVPRLIGFDVTSSKVLTERDFNCSSSSSSSSNSRSSKQGSL